MPTPAAEYACAACGAVAGRVEVVRSPTGAGNRLVLSVFASMWEEASPTATYAHAAEALRGGDPRALWSLNSEWAPFYCPACDACYCRAHWVEQVEFEDDFYDCTHGTCPRGHTRLLDD
ncbi:MAG TPA: hypothetical protein VEX86_19070 [Longimicrobium sp.]|nr:hypothetical protein [Longimicrobium sp.]